MSSLSDLPDDILGLISFWLNGFDNCSLWMASDSKLKQRLVENIITDFDIKYTIPGRFLWPGNFLKRLQRLSRLSLVVDEDLSFLPIGNIEVFPIPSLKHLTVNFCNFYHIFEQKRLIASNNATGPTTSSSSKYINLDDYYCNLEHLEIITSADDCFSIDFLRCLPQKLKTLLIPEIRFILDSHCPNDHLNTTFEKLPRTLTNIDLRFNSHTKSKPYLDLSTLPPNLTSLTTDALLDKKSCPMLPKSLKSLSTLPNVNSMDDLSPLFLPTGIENLSISIDVEPSNNQTFTHLEHLKELSVNSIFDLQLNQLITKCPPKLEKLTCRNLIIKDLPLPTTLFSNHLTKLVLYNVSGTTSEFISCLPQSLTHLEVFRSRAQPTFAFFSALPRQLKSLSTNFDVVENMSSLPESLTYLLWNSNYACDASCFDRLPPKLETLITKQKLPRSIMKQLPASLTYLNVVSDEIIDDEIVAMLPRGLKRLNLDAPDNITDAGVAHLPRNLVKLSLFKNTQLTDDGVGFLPRSLMHLNLHHNPNFSDKCIKDLPPKLTVIHLTEATEIKSKSCKDLPRYLEMLSIPNCNHWDSEMLKASKDELPRFIKNVHLGNIEASRTWRSIISENQREFLPA